MAKKIISGDVIKVNRGLYDHYGICTGNNTVVHYQGNTPNSAYVKETSLKEFEKGGKAEVANSKGPRHSSSAIIKTAKSSVGSGLGEYNLLTNNCEHFAKKCETGDGHSSQVDDALDIAFNPVRGLETIGSAVISVFSFFK